MSRQSGRRGPIGGLVGLVGQGVGMAAEYREHRRQQRDLRGNSQQEDGQPHQDHSDEPQGPSRSADAPPAYEDVANTTGQPLESSLPLTTEKEGQAETEGQDLTDSDSGSSLGSSSIEDDEEDWELDELEELEGYQELDSTGLPSYEESEAMQENETVEDLVREVISSSQPTHLPGPSDVPQNPLPGPVILPQRRPRKKSRGFVRAYSPLLKNCGIGQATFLKFLKNFHKSSQASPIFPAVAIAARIAGLAPSVIAMAVCTTVEVGARVGSELQARSRTNNFLDLMNEQLFRPAGVYAMIVKYKPDAEMEQTAPGRGGLLSSLIQTEHVDVTANQSIAKYAKPLSTESAQASSSDVSERIRNLRLSSGTTRGSAQLPLAAPLIYPHVDYKLDHGGPETFKDKAADAKEFLADYMDRRAQMQYASQNPDSALAVPESQRTFKSPLADPDHSMHSGGLVALASGGKLTPRKDRRERRRERRLERDARRIERGRAPRHERRRARRYGDEYHEELSARTGLERARRGPIGGLLSAASATHSERHNARNTSKAQVDQTTDASQSGQSSTGAGSGKDASQNGEGSSKQAKHRPGRGEARRDRQKRRGGPGGLVRRVLREDVLYLTIVNMPSEAELAEAREELAGAKAGD